MGSFVADSKWFSYGKIRVLNHVQSNIQNESEYKIDKMLTKSSIVRSNLL